MRRIMRIKVCLSAADTKPICHEITPHLDTGHNILEDAQVHAQVPIWAAGHLGAPGFERARVGVQHHDEVISILAIVQQLAHAWPPPEALQNGYL